MRRRRPRPVELISDPSVAVNMPKTLEVKCTNAECELDMFELHYTYDMPDETSVEDFSCPYCGSTDDLEEIVL